MTERIRNAVRRAACAVGLAAVLTTPLIAGQQAPPRPQVWEVDVTGGAALSTNAALPSTNATVANGPFFVAPGIIVGGVRSVSSWFLSASSAFVIPAIVPLTVPAIKPGASPRYPGVVGGHVTRWLSPRLGLEFGVAYSPGPAIHLDKTTLAAIESSRASFVTAFGAIFDADPFIYGKPSVTAVTADNNDAGGQVLTTGAIVLAESRGRARKYVTIGGGVRSPVGASPTVSVTGHYSFTAPHAVAIDETDAVTIRHVASSAAVLEVGAGIRWFVGAHNGVRLDARGTVGAANDKVAIDVTPASQTGSPAGFIVQQPGNGHATIVFSNSPTQQTSLSGPTITNLVTAKGHGARWELLVTAGWFWGF